MAKKSKGGNRSASAKKRASRTTGSRQRLLLGGAILLVVIAVVVGMQWSRKQSLPPRLQGATDGHYTKGAAQAAVVIKEFSDYT